MPGKGKISWVSVVVKIPGGILASSRVMTESKIARQIHFPWLSHQRPVHPHESSVAGPRQARGIRFAKDSNIG